MSTIATTLLGVTIGGSLIALVLLTAMARRVRRTGGYRARTGGWLRALTPIPLGLGGWFLAALLVWTVGPTTSIIGAVVVVPAVGVPVGLGTYAAWARRGRPVRTGLAVALGGAVAGAALGHGAGSTFTAPLTAIVGAAAVANLALLTLDIPVRRPRRAHTAQ